jgi:hypothetical protein
MISLDEVRQEVVAAFKQVHDANYPTTLVNYPNLIVVDIENQVDPFVSVDLDLSETERSAVGEKELLVPGNLNVIFYYRENTGTTSSWQYADMLNTNLGMSQVGALQFHPVKPMNIKTFDGWDGLMCTVRFDVVKELSCS